MAATQNFEGTLGGIFSAQKLIYAELPSELGNGAGTAYPIESPK
jgi:hypothetical protein